jgi:hypothetical protein
MPPIQTGIPQVSHAPQIEELERVTDQVKGISTFQEVKQSTSSYMHYIDKYKAKGVDLEQVYKQLRRSSNEDDIKRDFYESKEHGPLAQFLELMPLLANKPGRLGPVMNVKVTKTAKPDDEGNGAVDLIVEITNEFLKK